MSKSLKNIIEISAGFLFILVAVLGLAAANSFYAKAAVYDDGCTRAETSCAGTESRVLLSWSDVSSNWKTHP